MISFFVMQKRNSTTNTIDHRQGVSFDGSFLPHLSKLAAICSRCIFLWCSIHPRPWDLIQATLCAYCPVNRGRTKTRTTVSGGSIFNLVCSEIWLYQFNSLKKIYFEIWVVDNTRHYLKPWPTYDTVVSPWFDQRIPSWPGKIWLNPKWETVGHSYPRVFQQDIL